MALILKKPFERCSQITRIQNPLRPQRLPRVLPHRLHLPSRLLTMRRHRLLCRSTECPVSHPAAIRQTWALCSISFRKAKPSRRVYEKSLLPHKPTRIPLFALTLPSQLGPTRKTASPHEANPLIRVKGPSQKACGPRNPLAKSSMAINGSSRTLTAPPMARSKSARQSPILFSYRAAPIPPSASWGRQTLFHSTIARIVRSSSTRWFPPSM